MENVMYGDLLAWKKDEDLSEEGKKIKAHIGQQIFKVEKISCPECGGFDSYHLNEWQEEEDELFYCASFPGGILQDMQMVKVSIKIKIGDKTITKYLTLPLAWFQYAS